MSADGHDQAAAYVGDVEFSGIESTATPMPLPTRITRE
jgi:hypothetical protein